MPETSYRDLAGFGLDAIHLPVNANVPQLRIAATEQAAVAIIIGCGMAMETSVRQHLLAARRWDWSITIGGCKADESLADFALCRKERTGRSGCGGQPCIEAAYGWPDLRVFR